MDPSISDLVTGDLEAGDREAGGLEAGGDPALPRDSRVGYT